MNKLSTLPLTLLLAVEAIAQYTLPAQTVNVTTYGLVQDHQRTYQALIPDNDQDRDIWLLANAAGPLINTSENRWSNGGIDGLVTNIYLGGGSTAIMRGDDIPYAYIEMNGSISGMIYAHSSSAAGNTTDIVGKDSPLESSITGLSLGTVYSDNPTPAVVFKSGSAGALNFYEGNFIGASGYNGGYLQNSGALYIQGTSFTAGDYITYYATRNPAGYNDNNANTYAMSYAASGLYVESASSLTISNKTGAVNDSFVGSSIGSVALDDPTITESTGTPFRWIIGGDGLTARSVSGTTRIYGGSFIASQQERYTTRAVQLTEDYTASASINVSGGNGVAMVSGSGAVTIDDGQFTGGGAGTGTAGGPNASVTANAGSGLYLQGKGAITIEGGEFTAGSAGEAYVQTGITESAPSGTDANGSANAIGGSGIRISGSGATTINNATATGTRGGTASASSVANASGGAGINLLNTATTINGGTFTGGDGGSARGDGATYAYGGAGAYVSGSSLTINGGTFSGGRSGTADSGLDDGKIGVWAQDANLTIASTSGNTTIKGDVIFNNAAANNLTITGGTITGDINKYGAGTTTMAVSGAGFSGAFNQYGGAVNVVLSDTSESKYFSDVNINSGNMTFSGAKVTLADNAQFTMNNSSNTLDFGAAGVVLGSGATIDASYNQVTTAGDLDMGKNSAINYNFDTLNKLSGSLTVGGALSATNQNAKIRASGISDVASGSKKIVTAGSLVGITSSNALNIVDVDFGWLTQVTNVDLTGGITVTYGYNSLTNSSLSDLGAALTNVDAVVLGMTNTEFYAINALGASKGSEMFRYSLSQMPDTSESSIQVAQKVNGQIAARGTEFRSMNGFASTKPNFSDTPEGVAGPQAKENGTMQGWIRAYGSTGDKDATGKFAAYDSTTWGTVIGVDKNFNNLLVGLAGGYAHADLDEGSAYDADINTYYGSVYSTYGGESLFIDLALTYGMSDTDENNQTIDMKGSFDSSLFSAYLGAGYRFDIGEKLAITPEASILGSYYTQDEYTRTSILGPATIEDYDTTSTLGSIGVNLASQHQIDWLNRGIAFIPEVRAFYIHEFNADPDDFTYSLGGVATQFAVRPRDENLFRLGFGTDMWSWKWQRTKLELDYDALISDTYFEQVVSGKVSLQF
ncbi:autotransporter domain-containing protein [Pontiellaceae bacterium B12219]|nr:autotransporter domain-containing protein [Pontiellaceae bacterium B12219]